MKKVITMIKKYKYFLIAILLVLATPITTDKLNTSLNTFNPEESEYVGFVENLLQEIDEVQIENPINKGSFKSQGEVYTYNALREREKILEEYTYTDDMVPTEYMEFHHRMVEYITIYREGINTAKEGVLLMRVDIIEQGISKILNANELLIKLKEEFIIKQVPPEK
jgi:hypothetical protein